MWLNMNYKREHLGIRGMVSFCLAHSKITECHIKQSSKILYPKYNDNNACTLMLLSNPAYPEWVSIDCKKKFLVNVVCMQNATQVMRRKQKSVLRRCDSYHILRDTNCYWFIFCCEKGVTLQSIVQKTKIMTFTSASLFKFFLVSISAHFPNLHSLHNDSMDLIKQHSYDRYFGIFRYQIHNVLP